MISDLIEITEEDIPVICNYLNEEAYKNGIRKNPSVISRATTYDLLDPEVSKYKIVKGSDEIIAFLVYRFVSENSPKNELTNCFIREDFRSHKSTVIPISKKLVETFGEINVMFKRMYPSVDKVTKYTTDTHIDIKKLNSYIKRLEKYN